MKKKAIEKIPFLGLGKISRKKKARYVGVTAVRTVGNEEHLFLEVYRNDKESKDVPVVRVVLAEKDFGSYYPERGEWTREKVKKDSDGNNLIWEGQEEHETWKQQEEKNILQSTEDLERIKKFCKSSAYSWESWWEYLYKHEKDIVITARREKKRREYLRRREALQDRIENTKELPEEKILNRANAVCFHNGHYLYYKIKGSWAQIACSACGGVTDARWKEGESFESMFQRRIEKPREGYYGTCPLCGARGRYKCKGKVKGKHSRTAHLFLGQRYKESGMVFRYVQVEKTWILGLVCGEKETEMYNACEELSGVEIARAYFEPGKKTQIDFQKYDPYTEKDFWDDCNLYGMQNISIDESPIMPETYDEMKGTMFQYSAMKEYDGKVKEMNPIKYLNVYKEIPQLEMLVKMGLIRVAQELVSGNVEIVEDKHARRLDEFLGIRKERVKQLIKKHGDIRLLETMQIEKGMGENWTEEQIEHLTETGLDMERVETAQRYMTLQKLLNRIEKYAGCQYGVVCSSSEARIRHTATIYTDYLYMRINLGYDLSNTVYQQPRDLEAAHASMVAESNKEEADKRIKEVEMRYPGIRESYRKLRMKYFYEDENYIIRPAASAEEIVMEGRILHHCVGGDRYLGKHNRGVTYILMLRFKEKPQIPYITVEISAKDNKILQWYGEKDRKPDAGNMQKWLDSYLMKLKSGSLAETAGSEVA
ncbi:PcfJ domain-containing protein [Blautia argi]|uniref:PcfJ domain-containing protein n=1 Tax=Blautia argi TaxID=1912897 RepID=UPI002943BB79|nr:PcfJ domain-containing protein [Blautia argi]